MIVGITDTMGSNMKFMKYINWLRGAGPDVECRTLSYDLDNLPVVDLCDAIVMTGGHDVDPGLYGGPSGHSKIVDVDRKRDDFERKVVDRALRLKKPLLGICRGLQLVNVHLGGTLIPDIEEAGYLNHRGGKDEERRHDIDVEPNSSLYSIAGVASGNINTSHHQGARDLGTGLSVSARSPDGIIEALEFGTAGEQQFVLLVQWHPERMSDPGNPLSKNILDAYLSSVHLRRQ